MQNVSELYTTARADTTAWHEYKAVVGGVEYGRDRIMGAPETVKSLFSGNTPGIGGCVSQTVTLALISPDPAPPRMAKIELFCRVHGNGVTSEWMPKGVFFTDTRDPYSTPGALILNGYDAMLKMETPFVVGEDYGDWPRSPQLVMQEIAAVIGVELENADALGDISVPHPGSLTMREVSSGIAAAAGGNWTITDAGALRFVPFVQALTPIPLGMAAAAFGADEPFLPFTGVRLSTEDDTTFFAGSEIGRVLTATVPWASEEMAISVLSAVQGYVYQPFEAEDALLDPAAELGDCLEIGGTTVLLAKAITKMDMLCAADISAPADEEIDHEYPYIDPATRQTERKIAQNRSLIEKTSERILLEVESQSGDIADLQVHASEIESRVQSAEGEITVLQQEAGKVRVIIVDQEGTLETTIDADSWEAIRKNLEGETTSGFWFDFEAGQFVFDGTGEFKSRDGMSYITIEGNELVLHSSRSGTMLDKLRIGFISGTDPSGMQDVDYPYILLGNTTSSGGSGLLKKFWDGLFIGNSYAKDASGRFSPQADYAGFFVDTITGVSYVVSGTEMQNVYTGEAIAKFG